MTRIWRHEVARNVPVPENRTTVPSAVTHLCKRAAERQPLIEEGGGDRDPAAQLAGRSVHDAALLGEGRTGTGTDGQRYVCLRA